MLYRLLKAHPLTSLRSALVIAPFLVAACSDDGLLPTGPDPAPETTPAPAFAEAIPNYWTTRAKMPTGRSQAVAVNVNGIIYVIGGRSENIGPVSRFDAYNPSTNTLVAWTPRAALPVQRARANGAVAINGKIYVAGGINGQGVATRTLYVYDIAGNYWVAKAQMPVASEGGISVGMGGKLYVVVTLPGENQSFSSPSRLFRYDPAANSWIELAPAPNHHYNGVGRVIDGKFYVAGGVTYTDEDGIPTPQAVGYLDVYNATSNTWISKAQMHTPRFGAVSGVLDGTLYVAGGWTGAGGPVGTLEFYSPASNAWTYRVDLPTPRGDAAGATAGGRLHVMGGMGDNETIVNKNESYNP